jgi:hypothetical protein
MNSLRTGPARGRYWRQIDRRRKVWVHRGAAKAAERFGQEGQYVTYVFYRAGIEAALTAVTAHAPQWLDYYAQLYHGVAGEFGEHILRQIETAKSRSKSVSDVFRSAVNSWLVRHGARRVNNLTATSRDVLANDLAQGTAANESIPQLAGRIQGRYNDWSQTRARTIARTEVIAASNLGSYEAARASGIPLDKIWVATNDDRTRAAHAAADGQKQHLDEFFLVEGEQLLWPGDSSHGATPDNTINCRCTVGYQAA